MRKKRNHCILIKTGKAEFVVPAALFLACPAVSGCCMAGACRSLCIPELGLDCESCCSSSPTNLSWHSQHYFRVRSEGKNVVVQLTGTLLFLFFLLGDLIFSSHFPLLPLFWQKEWCSSNINGDAAAVTKCAASLCIFRLT